MDNEEARFILRSFRPDGSDVNDADFAETLKLAMENRELGEWLAHERAVDAAFAKAVGSLPLPENLRADVLGCLAAERGDFEPAADAGDAVWFDAFSSIQAPAGLRDQVLAAMDRTAPAPEKIVRFPRWAMPLAAAAGIALAILLVPGGKPKTVAKNESIPIQAVQAGFVRTFESSDFYLEVKHTEHPPLMAHLTERNLPCPQSVPRGLKALAGVGCRELVIDGKRGSLICFDRGKDGLVHLVVLRREDVEGDFPKQGFPPIAQNGEWATTTWEQDGQVMTMLAKTGPKNLSALF